MAKYSAQEISKFVARNLNKEFASDNMKSVKDILPLWNRILGYAKRNNRCKSFDIICMVVKNMRRKIALRIILNIRFLLEMVYVWIKFLRLIHTSKLIRSI